MSNNSSNIKMLIQKLAGTFGKADVKLMDVTVKSVDKINKTCIVNSVDGNYNIDGLKVRLALEVCDGNLEYPEEDSTITIAFTDFTEPYMVSATWLTEKDITVGNQCWNIKDGKQYFNSDKFGGIPIVKDPDNSDYGLKERLNKVEKDLNDLKNKLASAFVSVVSEPGSGSPSAFQASLSSIFTGLPVPAPTPLPTSYCGKELTETTDNMISNPSVFHGKKVITT